ncbi:MAG: DUF6141 family protein [Flavisolibacter sp.]
MSSILFTEKQRFTQWWLWVILLCVNVLLLYGVYYQLVEGKPFGDNPASDPVLVLVTVFIILLTISFYIFQLETEIRTDGIYVRPFPFAKNFRRYPWEEISKSFVREYSALREYGGWGFRLGIFGRGRAYNVSGNRGLQLEFTNGKRLLIGTNKPEEMTAALQQLGKLKS